MKLAFFGQIFEKVSNIKFYQNLSSGTESFHANRHTDGHDEGNSCFPQFLERLNIGVLLLLLDRHVRQMVPRAYLLICPTSLKLTAGLSKFSNQIQTSPISWKVLKDVFAGNVLLNLNEYYKYMVLNPVILFKQSVCIQHISVGFTFDSYSARSW
jgi:hypothetical protein